ncbi:hypothetical protein ABXL43_37985, partial [Burkholderia sola]
VVEGPAGLQAAVHGTGPALGALAFLAFGATAMLATTGGSGSGAVTYAVTGGAQFCAVTGNQLNAIGAGNCTITATKAGDPNHQATSASTTVIVTKAGQTALSVQASPAA